MIDVEGKADPPTAVNGAAHGLHPEEAEQLASPCLSGAIKVDYPRYRRIGLPGSKKVKFKQSIISQGGP